MGTILRLHFKYSLAWKEFILTEIAFSSIYKLKGKLIADSTLYKYLIEHEKFKGDFVTRFSNAILKAFTGGKLSVLESEVDIDFSSFRGLTSPEQEEIRRSLTELIQENDYFVLIDNLDEPWKNNDLLIRPS